MNLPLFFVSDIHLRLSRSEGEIAKRNDIIQFIEHVAEKGGTLFIVGDFFDFWFEYKYVIPKAYFDVLVALYQAKTQGVEIHYVLGNHDFWVREFAKETLFTKIYYDGLTFKSNGHTFFVTHGDGVLSWDKGYRTLKKVIRNGVLVLLFRWIHPDIGYTFARWVSKRGRHLTHTDEYNKSVMAELENVAEEKWAEGVDHIIFGHYHQSKQIVNEKGSLLVLGDWITHRSFGYFDGKEFSLNYWR